MRGDWTPGRPRYDRSPVYHLPAYVALSRWVVGRSVLIAAPRDPEGVRCFVAAGARVVLVGGDVRVDGVERRDGVPELPFDDARFDVVVCLESFSELDARARSRLLAQARRVLKPDGVFAAWTREMRNGSLDFYGLEEALSIEFPRVRMLAQMPWSGCSLAPVIDDDVAAMPQLALSEALLDEAPVPTHYLAIGGDQDASAAMLDRLTRDCLLVPLSAQEDRAAELDGLRTELTEQVEATRSAEVELERLAGQSEALRADLADARAERERIERDRVEQERVANELRERQREVEERIEEARARIESLQAELESSRMSEPRLRDQLAAAQERIVSQTGQLEDLRAEREGLTASKLSAQRDIDRLETEHERLRAELAQGQAEAQRARVQYEGLEVEKKELESQIERLRLRVEELVSEQRQAQDRARTRDTDLAVLTRTVDELEKSLARTSEQADTSARELEARARHAAELGAKVDSLSTERDDLVRQLEVALAERDGAQQLTNRAEAELEVTRRRLGSQEEQLRVKLEEASRLGAEAQVMRERLQHQSEVVEELRSREGDLKSSVAQGAEKGRMLTEVALDRDRLREELTSRSQEIQKLEERLWSTREDVQKERLENVRLGGEVERLREQVERSHEAEVARAREVERLSGELRKLEVERGELAGLLRSRDEAIARLQRESEALSSESADLDALRKELSSRGDELGRLRAELEQALGRERETSARARKREEQLSRAGADLEALRKTAEENAALASNLRGELQVKTLEVEQLAASVANLQGQLGEQRRSVDEREDRTVALQRQLEEAASERESLRARLREREQELDDLASTYESSDVEMFKLRRELEVASQANEQLEEALRSELGADLEDEEVDTKNWPESAISAARRLHAQLAAQTRRHAEQLAARDAVSSGPATGRDRIRRLQLEVEVRAEEQEQLLGALESAEQKIWEMEDAADRNAARLAAGLAQLEKHKEQLDETLDELEVTRKQLAAAQARALEQERLLASERAKLARAGVKTASRDDDPLGGVDDVFAELELGDRDKMMDLGGRRSTASSPSPSDAAAVPTPVEDREDGSGVLDVRPGPRIVVEAIEEDGWEKDVTRAQPETVRRAKRPRGARGAGSGSGGS